MYLKSIEVHGFKSFANKIVFQFHNGITAIVGPNGSGKSNVADAVRWVLGEQRIKQLRGESMQDVIFSGTETRKPMGYAYVAITLDNKDHQLPIEYNEVTVARRIYRSGESEYLINGTLCRLKDVTELFYDTGIGKDGYSIIGQGQIDKILSGKPEERRELFDEAAGIVKFKRRKYAAQKKLEDEQQNLLRVNDILSELERQVGPLEKQSEKAKIFLSKRDQLKTLDVNVFLLENASVHNKLSQVEEKFKIANCDLTDAKEDYEKIRVDYENIQNEIENLDREIEEARSSMASTSVLKGKLEGEINVLKEQIHSLEENKIHFNARLKSVQDEIDTESADKCQILDKKKEIDLQVQEFSAEKDKAQSSLVEIQNEITRLNSNIEDSKNKVIDALNQRATIKSQMGRYDTMLEQIQIRKSELNSRLLRAKSAEEEQQEVIKKLEEEFLSVTDELRILNEKKAEIESRLGAIKGELTEEDASLRENQEKYHQEKSRLETLSDIAERYEGYGGSVKKVMEQKEQEKGIIGVVADIIKVDSKYETAIETALGANIQNIVTDDEKTAKAMIAYLKKNRFGRATFLPLTSIKDSQKFKHEDALKEEGVLGIADSLVQIDNKYRDVAKAMLGRILVVDNVDHAVQIARKFSYGIRMVTLEGEMLIPGGAISGGAFKKNNNLLGRRREIEELKKRVQKLSGEIELNNRHIAEIKEERNQLRKDSISVNDEIQNKTIVQNTKRLNVVQEKEKQVNTEQDFDELRSEEQELSVKTKEIDRKKDEILSELKESESVEEKMNELITGFQKELETKREEESAQLQKGSEWDLKVEKMIQTQAFHQENIDRLNAELEKFELEKQELQENINKNISDISYKEKNISEIEKTILASHTSHDEFEEKLKKDIEKKDELNEKQKNFFASRENLGELISRLDKEVYRLGTQKEKMEETMESRINYMWDEYEVTLSDASAMRDENFTDLTSMKRDIAALKDQIKKLGDVNVNAIEDYKNLMERYNFLKTQHDDLVEAEKNLENIIVDLDASMRKQFQEKFAEISKEFDKVFKELFGGGKGTLELMEDEDILEAGIRIIAQPPGKKLQNMMQLSGGEKSLTAIALLFAIQNLKPSPFCLLDEIEAALDESNVIRFGKYLHKLTKNTQFIVITHRRGTMEKADRLYGITMQEKGISTLVSVNLIDKDLED